MKPIATTRRHADLAAGTDRGDNDASETIRVSDQPDARPAVAGSSPATPALRSRRDGWTPARQEVFLAALGKRSTVAGAAAAAGMSRESAYRLRANPRAAAFAAAWRRIDADQSSGPTARALFQSDEFFDRIYAAAERRLDEARTRPDFERWLIRRLGVEMKRRPNREPV